MNFDVGAFQIPLFISDILLWPSTNHTRMDVQTCKASISFCGVAHCVIFYLYFCRLPYKKIENPHLSPFFFWSSVDMHIPMSDIYEQRFCYEQDATRLSFGSLPWAHFLHTFNIHPILPFIFFNRIFSLLAQSNNWAHIWHCWNWCIIYCKRILGMIGFTSVIFALIYRRSFGWFLRTT